jgi:hypothetical protein
MATGIAPLITTNRASVSDVRRVIRKALTEYLFSIGKSYPAHDESTLELERDLHLEPNSPHLELVCNRISERLFCDKPHRQTRGEWIEFMDLYLYYLARGLTQE